MGLQKEQLAMAQRWNDRVPAPKQERRDSDGNAAKPNKSRILIHEESCN